MLDSLRCFTTFQYEKMHFCILTIMIITVLFLWESLWFYPYTISSKLLFTACFAVNKPCFCYIFRWHMNATHVTSPATFEAWWRRCRFLVGGVQVESFHRIAVLCGSRNKHTWKNLPKWCGPNYIILVVSMEKQQTE